MAFKFKNSVIKAFVIQLTLPMPCYASPATPQVESRAMSPQSASYASVKYIEDGTSSNERILVRSSTVEDDTFKAYATANGFTRFSVFLEQNRPSKEMSQLLSNTIKSAQNAWLNGAIGDARKKYMKIMNLAEASDWRPDQREVIQYALMRLAQTALSSDEAKTFLSKAAMLYGDLQPDSTLFPPPLVDQYLEILMEAKASSKTLNLGEKLEGFQVLFIDGRKYLLTKDLKVKVSPGTHRVSIYSDILTPINAQLTLEELEAYQPDRHPISSGSCTQNSLQFKMARAEEIKTVYTLYAHECLAQTTLSVDQDPSQATPVKVQLTNDSIDLLVRSAPVEMATDDLARHNSLRDARAASQGDSFYSRLSDSQKKWMWIGVGALALGGTYLIADSLQNESSQEPMVITIPAK